MKEGDQDSHAKKFYTPRNLHYSLTSKSARQPQRWEKRLSQLVPFRRTGAATHVHGSKTASRAVRGRGQGQIIRRGIIKNLPHDNEEMYYQLLASQIELVLHFLDLVLVPDCFEGLSKALPCLVCTLNICQDLYRCVEF
jgi:hypothetical protein